MGWQFYGRQRELGDLTTIMGRSRFFFVRVAGRRRIGKTTLVRQALEASGRDRIFYVQIPDSGPAGVLSAVRDAMATFRIAAIPAPATLLELARFLGTLMRQGHVVALDEFQYFSRKALQGFLSHLQAVVDDLLADADNVPGGLLVLGSMHAELTALLDDRDAPLYNRTTDVFQLAHLDIASLLAILAAHADTAPERLLFLWNLFEGVPKFYRDCYEQGVLDADRRTLITRMFFGSSSPLRSEADNWFLSELRGRYDVILKLVARQPGCSQGDIMAHARETSPETAEHIGGYLRVLGDRYGLIERRLPIFAKPGARTGRYHLCDNFLASWLAALQGPVSALNFRPVEALVAQADARLAESEGRSFERLVAQLHAECSRAGVGDFQMTRQLGGYWDRRGVEIDLVALDEEQRIIRFVTCKRDAQALRGEPANLDGHITRFLAAHGSYAGWQQQRLACAPRIDTELRGELESRGMLVRDLRDLTVPLQTQGRRSANA